MCVCVVWWGTQMSAIMDSLPPALRLDLACAMNHSLFAKVRTCPRPSWPRSTRACFLCEFLTIFGHSAVLLSLAGKHSTGAEGGRDPA